MAEPSLRLAGAPDRPPRPRILIVDDSAVARAVIARAIAASERFDVAGTVSGADAALAFLRGERVDAIVLDIEMPGVDGLTALPDLLIASAGAKVLIVSAAVGDGAAATIQALALGAADTLVKPEAGALAGRFGHALEEKLARLLAPEAEDAIAAGAAASATHDGFDVVAIGASTGGIHALSALLRELPAGFALPILITQHLPASFMPYFAAQVAVLAARPCDIAADHMRIRPGRIVVAPGDAHLRCVGIGDGAAIRLSHAPAPSGCLPSVDPMFERVAQVYGARALAVVLSGMGRDGNNGACHIGAAGGSVVVQDQASSVVWGMPGVIASGGRADAILPPDRIGQLIASRRRPRC